MPNDRWRGFKARPVQVLRRCQHFLNFVVSSINRGPLPASRLFTPEPKFAVFCTTCDQTTAFRKSPFAPRKLDYLTPLSRSERQLSLNQQTDKGAAKPIYISFQVCWKLIATNSPSGSRAIAFMAGSINVSIH